LSGRLLIIENPGAEIPSIEIQGKQVSFPVVVREASSGVAMFFVDAAVARSFLPDSKLDVLEVFPGKAVLTISAIDYKVNDLGDYNEVAIAFFVREATDKSCVPYLGDLVSILRGRAATYIRHLPVNQSFTREAGSQIWGFPKTVEEISFAYETQRTSCRLVMDGKLVLDCSFPRRGTGKLKDSLLSTYSYIEGVLHKTLFVSGASGMGQFMSGTSVELGEHPIADELRSLGLPKRPFASAWIEKMHARFDPPQKVE
jgi:hypothetical protein